MKIFIWNKLENLTGNYHPEGGLVVVADNLVEARAYIAAKAIEHDSAYWLDKDCDALTKDPDFVFDVSCKIPMLFSFPNSGCC